MDWNHYSQWTGRSLNESGPNSLPPKVQILGTLLELSKKSVYKRKVRANLIKTEFVTWQK
jgi:hypothetical protein